jgi:hypothetical protein
MAVASDCLEKVTDDANRRSPRMMGAMEGRKEEDSSKDAGRRSGRHGDK